MAPDNQGPGPAAPKPPAHVSEHLGNERTYLAYLRTTIALMTFGIAINRFSRFLEQSDRVKLDRPHALALFRTENFGSGMLVLGAVLLVWAAVRYTQIQRQIELREFRPHAHSVWIITGLILFAVGTGVGWLVLS